MEEENLTSQDLQGIAIAIESHMLRYNEPVLNPTFKRYSLLMAKVKRIMEVRLVNEEIRNG